MNMNIRQSFDSINPSEEQKKKMLAVILNPRSEEKTILKRRKSSIRGFSVVLAAFVFVGGTYVAYKAINRNDYDSGTALFGAANSPEDGTIPNLKLVETTSIEETTSTQETTLVEETTTVEDIVVLTTIEHILPTTMETTTENLDTDLFQHYTILKERIADDYNELQESRFTIVNDMQEQISFEEYEEKYNAILGNEKMLFTLRDALNSTPYKFDFPIKGEFTIPESVINQAYNNHALGVTIHADEGTEIYASADGYVVDLETENGYYYDYGKTVILDHGDEIKTLYGYCSEILVESGTFVQKGQLIAIIGDTGRTTGPFGVSGGAKSLCFELYVNDIPYSPLAIFDVL